LIDVNADRLAMSAERVHPHAAIDGSADDPVEAVRKLTGGRGPDVVITAAPAGRAQEQAIEMAAPQGRISFFGGLPKEDPYIRCDSNLVHYRELSLVGANGSSPAHNRRALQLIAGGAVPVADLITHRLPLDQVQAAIEAVISGTAIKVVVEP
jgi:L-iditol 2-dehydrogenase